MSAERWPGKQFGEAFESVRETVGQAELLMDGGLVTLTNTAYEYEHLTELLDGKDVEELSEGKNAISPGVRDRAGRWREVLDDIGVSQTIGFGELLKGMADGYFNIKPVEWWVEAGAKVVEIHPDEQIFGAPFLLTTDGRTVSCAQEGTTSRPLVFGDAVSDFARRWRLLDQIHDAYGRSEAGKQVRDWLVKHAAYTIDPNPSVELAAFAEYHTDPVEVTDEQLREIRDRFDSVTDRSAAEIGALVGRAILLNGHHHKNGTRRPCKVSPPDAYLPKTLDSEHPDWPEAAADLPGLTWLSASYDDALKSLRGKRSKRRADGGMSRGARRFLMLLGAECAPRLVMDERHQYPERESQRLEVQSKGAQTIGHDVKAPDLERVVLALHRMNKRERRTRGAALIRVLSRHWPRVYSSKVQVPAYHQVRRNYNLKGYVSADWLRLLKDVAWVVVGNGELSEPSKAVIRSPQTETLYDSKTFITGIDSSEINDDFAAAIGLITAVRASDLVEHLKAIKRGDKPADVAHIMLVYRTLSKLCPAASDPWGAMGDVSPSHARNEFGMGTGLICLRRGEWRKPSDLFSGRDIFHETNLFVPGGAAYADLWRFLQIRPPELSDCTRYCRKLALKTYSVTSEAILMDIYRYMEELLAKSERTNKDRLNGLPLSCSNRWVDTRPVFFIENSEVRGQLEKMLPDAHFWSPPCELSGLPNFMLALGVQAIAPRIEVIAQDKFAGDEGDNRRDRFQTAVEALSSELARSEPATREKISITWDALRDLPLFVYSAPYEARASHHALNGGKALRISLRAYLAEDPRNLHVSEDAIGMPKTGGRAIASLFPWDVRPRIEAQWAASWMESHQQAVETMRFAADAEQVENLLAATLELADTLDVAGGTIEVSVPASRASSVKPRRLKVFQGGVTGATVQVGTPPTSNGGGWSVPLTSSPPPPSGPGSGGTRDVAPVEFTTADLEQRGWEILRHALNRSDAPELVDFRKRHGVGADGAIDWKKFVELKASARSLSASIEMTNAEYERAKEQGRDYILALVYGLEEGERTEARLIIDPIRNLAVRPVAGIRLVGLAQATAVILSFAEASESITSEGFTVTT